MSQFSKNPLGQVTTYPRVYSPQLLYAVSRDPARRGLGIATELPFQGEDLWNAWELSWLDMQGRPVVAVAEFRVPATSPNFIESKSLKLYLNSLAWTRYPSAAAVRKLIEQDLKSCAGSPVAVTMHSDSDAAGFSVSAFSGLCIDNEPATFGSATVDPRLLRSDPCTPVSESLHSHLLRSNCPVTQQPDTGSILISYRGPKIDRGTLLEYLVSFRDHEAFHEACVEQVFVDLKSRCAPERLTVYARYNRRGGLDINPFRSDFEQQAPNTRLWRQ